MTLVELLVGMAVTSIVLVGLTGALFNVTKFSEIWQGRLDDASTGAALAAALQQDSARSVTCSATNARLSTIRFCVPGTGTGPGTGTVTATYTRRLDGGTWSILRTATGQTILMARGVQSQPEFWIDCLVDAGTVSGHVHVYNYRRTGGSESFSVYYQAPLPPNWSPGPPDGRCPL